MSTKKVRSLFTATAVATVVGLSLVGAGGYLAAQEQVVLENLPISDMPYEQITSFEEIRKTWVRRAQTGSLKKDYQVTVIEEFAAAPSLFTPKPGDLLIYENTGKSGHSDRPEAERNTNNSSRIVVLDAKTRTVIASNEFDPRLSGSIHTTGVSPDGSAVYLTGPVLNPVEGKAAAPVTVGTLIKADALSLQPLKVLNVGGRLHHAVVVQDRYVMMDTFNRDPDGLDVFLFDPVTDQIIGGIRDEELGGATYTGFPDPTGEYIYILMEPTGYPSAYRAAGEIRTGNLRYIRPFWVAKVRLSDWSVEREYPYPGYRSDWLQFSADGKSFYVDGSGDDKVIKIDIETGDIVWSQATGPGPYGIEVNADNSQIWVADKGEAAGGFGRTITVIGDEKGQHISTVPAAYKIDHIVLSPNGKQMWATSNGGGKLWVFDADTRDLLDTIDMPGFGDPHGLVFVSYDADGKGQVVADQGDFHAGIDPRNGKPLAY